MRSLLIAGASSLLLTLGMSSIPAPSFAQFTNIQEISKSTPRSRVVFPRGKTSTNIQGADSRIFVLKAKAGQKLTLKGNSFGARAGIILYSANGKIVKSLGESSGTAQSFTYRLPVSGDYYILGYGGPTYHTYDFTVSIK